MWHVPRNLRSFAVFAAQDDGLEKLIAGLGAKPNRVIHGCTPYLRSLNSHHNSFNSYQPSWRANQELAQFMSPTPSIRITISVIDIWFRAIDIRSFAHSYQPRAHPCHPWMVRVDQSDQLTAWVLIRIA
jgi:hypothetical protein